MKKIAFTILLFMFIFSFKLPLINSSFYSSIFCILCIFCTLKISSSNIIELRARIAIVLFNFFVPLLFIAAIAALITLLHSSSDFSYSISILKVMVYILAFVPLMIIYVAWFDFQVEISKFMYAVFFIQSLIITISLIVPDLHCIISIFQFDDVIEISERYNGIRGLALAGPQFFALACSYIFVMIFIAYDFSNKKLSTKYTILVTVFMFFAAFSIGRTALIGVIIFYVIIFTSKLNVLKINKNVLNGVALYCLLLLFVGCYAIFEPKLNTLLLDNLIPFAFEFIVKYMDSGTLSTTSTDVLKNMYFPLSESTMLFGDGLYQGLGGVGYYMGTDAGYMRPVLFGGVGFFFMLILFWIYNIYGGLRIVYGKYIAVMVTLITLLLQYKGEVIVVQPTILMTLFPFIVLSKKVARL